MPDGSCPRCRTELVANPTNVDDGLESDSASAEARPAAKVPWHFWVMVAATCLYLGWRIVQGIGSLF